MKARLRARLARLAFRWGWDTRVRHRDSVRVVRETFGSTGAPSVLDAGSGAGGLAVFMPEASILGVDRVVPTALPANMTFAAGSVTGLPAADDAYDVVTSIDVFEYLPPDDRRTAVAEMLRVARRGILVSAPDGTTAATSDAAYAADLRARGRQVPEWIAEAEPWPYPTACEVIAAIAAADPQMHVRESRSEPLIVTRFLRFLAARSTLAYVAANLVIGGAAPLIPRREPSYRFVVVAVRNPGSPAAVTDRTSRSAP